MTTAILAILAVFGWLFAGLSMIGWTSASRRAQWWKAQAYEELRRKR